MSRIIIKNLPKMVTEEQLKAHFSDIGLITDVKLMRKKNGEFRGCAFLGFESCDSAEKACKQYKGSYFKQNKIMVEMYLDFDHKSKLESLKSHQHLTIERDKHFSQKAYNKLLKSKELTEESVKELLKDPNFIQYLRVNQKGTSDLVDKLKKKFEKSTNEIDNDYTEEVEAKDDSNKEEKLASKEISDWEYLSSLMQVEDKTTRKEKKYKKLYTVVIRTKEQNTSKLKKGRTFTKQAVKAFVKPLSCKMIRIPRRVSFVAYVAFKTEKEMKQLLMKDKSFLDGVRVRVHKHEEQAEESSDTSARVPWKEAELKIEEKASQIADSGRLFVRNLWYSVSEDELKELFEKYGPLADLTLPVSKLTRKPKGIAHVTYILPEHAVVAMNELDGKCFKGRILHILPSLLGDDEETEPKNFKEKKAKDLKKSASSWHNWNTLFLGGGAVIDLVTEKYGTSKQELFNDEGKQSAAVNLALGETQIIEETKRFLEAQGISLDAFSNPGVQRSSTVILAKNLPAKTSAQELKELFEKYGELGRVILPPSGVTGILEFTEPGEAKRAFQELAYSRFHYLPLFLEWAPVEVFKLPRSTLSTAVEQESSKLRTDEVEESNHNQIAPESNTTLYIKNLNFKTVEDDIVQHFCDIGPVVCALVSRRRGQSQGFGFVQFAKTKDAKQALKDRQNSTLHDHQILLKFSEKKLASSGIHLKGSKTKTNDIEATAKIMVKNIPFQATTNEIKELFRTFGELKSVRLPRKIDSSEHRGFGFIEFLTKEDAKKSFEALSASTHLYGRRLVLEWANAEESVDDIRKRTAERFLASSGGGSSNKRRKITDLEDKG